MPGKPYPHISRLAVVLYVKDGIELSELPSGVSRSGSIHKELFPHTPEEDDDTEEGSYQEMINAHFFKTIKYDTSLQTGPVTLAATGPDLSDEETIEFLRELLSSSVDPDATRKAYEGSEKDQSSDKRPSYEESSIHWNREKPLDMRKYFQY